MDHLTNLEARKNLLRETSIPKRLRHKLTQSSISIAEKKQANNTDIIKIAIIGLFG